MGQQGREQTGRDEKKAFRGKERQVMAPGRRASVIAECRESSEEGQNMELMPALKGSALQATVCWLAVSILLQEEM